MSPSKQIAAALGVFGLIVIAGGVVRYLTTPGGENGLYFGLVMGGIALLGAVLAGVNQLLAARIVGGFAIGVVVLWFGYDLYKDLSASFVIREPEIRKTIVLAVGVISAIVTFRPQRK